MFSRRAFLKSFGLGGAAASIAGTACSSTLSDSSGIESVELVLTYPKLHPDLRGFRIGFISDLHLGGWVPTELVIQSFKEISRKNIDVLVLGGDNIWVSEAPGKLSSFVNSDFVGKDDTSVARKVFEALSEIGAPFLKEFPIVTILGNHDRWSSFDAYKQFDRSGILTLENSSFVITRGSASVRIYGTEDLWTGIPLPPDNINPDEFLIVATHNPDYASYLYHKLDVPFQLALMGHTHGGQIKLPLMGAVFYNVRDLRYAEGLVDYGQTKFYTTRGIGVVEIPWRINCPPEITILELQRA